MRVAERNLENGRLWKNNMGVPFWAVAALMLFMFLYLTLFCPCGRTLYAGRAVGLRGLERGAAAMTIGFVANGKHW